MTGSDGPGPGDAHPKGEPDDRPGLDIDSAFAAIIADFSAPVPAGGGPWPASEDLADEDAGGGADATDAGDGGSGAPRSDAAPDGTGAGPAPSDAGTPDPDDTRDVVPPVGQERRDAVRRRIVLPGEDLSAGAAEGPAPASGRRATDRDGSGDSDDEGYVPPEPPPLPRGDLVSRLAWGAVIGGPLFLLAAALTWRTLPSMLLLIALIAFVGGFVTLVARMPQDHPDDPDDGAVV